MGHFGVSIWLLLKTVPTSLAGKLSQAKPSQWKASQTRSQQANTTGSANFHQTHAPREPTIHQLIGFVAKRDRVQLQPKQNRRSRIKVQEDNVAAFGGASCRAPPALRSASTESKDSERHNHWPDKSGWIRIRNERMVVGLYWKQACFPPQSFNKCATSHVGSTSAPGKRPSSPF